MGKKRQQVKLGRRSAALPPVKSMTDLDSVAPTTTPGAAKSEKPADEPSEELIRMIKAAYQ